MSDINLISENASNFVAVLNDYSNLTERYHSKKSELESTVENVLSNYKKLKDEGILRIGVIGTVKAGKSSLMNAVLFEGKEILPKAATPATAVLTRIQYSTENSLELEFMTEQDWEKIKYQAKKYINESEKYLGEPEGIVKDKIKNALGEEYVSSYELFSLAEKKGLNIPDYLGKSKKFEYSTWQDLEGELDKYVDAGGDYAAVTKSCSLKVNIDRLEDIEIVDTPGLNDPVISRVKRTNEFLGQCHAVLFLSYAGQFWDASNKEYLLRRIYGKENIKHIYIIASRFDQILKGVSKKHNNILDAVDAERKKRERTLDADSDLKTLPGDIKLLVSSAVTPIIADKLNDGLELNKLEKEVLDTLTRSYADNTFDSDLLREIGRVDDIKNAVSELKLEKEKIINEKLNEYIPTAERHLNEIKKDIYKKIENAYSHFKKSDIESLRNEIYSVISTVKKIEQSLKISMNQIRFNFLEAVATIDKKIIEFKNIVDNIQIREKSAGKEQTGEERIEYTVEVPANNMAEGAMNLVGNIFGRFEFKSTRTENRVEYIPVYKDVFVKTASKAQALQNIERFVENINSVITNELEKVFDYKKIKELIFERIEPVISTIDDFDQELILTPLDNILCGLSSSVLYFDPFEYKNKIENEFWEEEIMEENISSFMKKFKNVLADIHNDCRKKLDGYKNEKISLIDSIILDIADNIISDINVRKSELEQQLQEKKNIMTKYQTLIKKLTHFLS